jgi:hypothetical protein
VLLSDNKIDRFVRTAPPSERRDRWMKRRISAWSAPKQEGRGVIAAAF